MYLFVHLCIQLGKFLFGGRRRVPGGASSLCRGSTAGAGCQTEGASGQHAHEGMTGRYARGQTSTSRVSTAQVRDCRQIGRGLLLLVY